MHEDPTYEKRFDIAKTIMLIGFSTGVACAVMIMVAWAIVVLKGWPMSDSLDKMAAMAFTFTTTIAAFGKDFVTKVMTS